MHFTSKMYICDNTTRISLPLSESDVVRGEILRLKVFLFPLFAISSSAEATTFVFCSRIDPLSVGCDAKLEGVLHGVEYRRAGAFLFWRLNDRCLCRLGGAHSA